MRNFSVSAFKAHALGILQGVAETGETVLVTKRGKPLACVTPYADPILSAQPGKLAGTIAFENDLIAPMAELAGPSVRGGGKR